MNQLLRSSWKRALFALALSSFGALAFAQAATAFHESPQGGTPFRVPLVPSYPACTTPTTTHIPPLAGGACVGAAAYETTAGSTGTASTAGWGGVSNGFLRLQVCNQGAPVFGSNTNATCFPPSGRIPSSQGGLSPCGPDDCNVMPLPDDRLSGNLIDVVAKENGPSCAPGNVVDDDLDGVVNDGCPQLGATPDDGTGTLGSAGCTDAVNSDGGDDAEANDGCPGVGPYNPNPGAFWYTTSSGTAAVPPAPACFPQDSAGGATGTPRACNNNGAGTTAAGGVDMTVVAQIPANVGGTASIRITDHQNDPGTAYSTTGTVGDLPFPVPIVCRAHTGAAYADLGSDCGVNTTANALSPGAVALSAFAGDVGGVVQIGQVQVTLPFAGSSIFAVQGIFNP